MTRILEVGPEAARRRTMRAVTRAGTPLASRRPETPAGKEPKLTAAQARILAESKEHRGRSYTGRHWNAIRRLEELGLARASWNIDCHSHRWDIRVYPVEFAPS